MNKLWVRLSLAFTGVVLVAVIIVITAGIIIEQFDSNRDGLIHWFRKDSHRLAQSMTTYYQTHQSWDGAEAMLIGAQSIFFRDDVAFFLADSGEEVVYHNNPKLVGQSLNQIETIVVVPLQAEGQTIGFMGVVPFLEGSERTPPFFVRALVEILLGFAVIGGIGGIIFGIIVSRTLTAPLGNLADAARAIGARNLSRRVEEKGSDEIIAVARAFNDMASDLEQSEQLRRNLLSDVAHELRTPLTVLQGNLRAILDEVYPLNLEEMVRLYEHTRFLNRLVNDLHELAQAEAHQLPLHIQETNLNQLLNTTGDTFRPGAEAKGISLSITVPPQLPPVQVDSARITQVLQNLLANALRHTPDGGTISIGSVANTSSVRLTISDTGDGISPEHLPHVFDRFYRTDPARTRDKGGAGLGLAIARAIIETHGGQINVDSTGILGEGTTFTVQLPVTEK